MKWNDLTMKERSDLMSLFLKAGVGSLSDMKKIYEEYQPLEGAAPYKYPAGGELKPATMTEKLGRNWGGTQETFGMCPECVRDAPCHRLR